MMRIQLLFLSAAVLCAVLLAGCSAGPAAETASVSATAAVSEDTAVPVTVFAMDTVMELTPYGPNAEEAGTRAAARLQELDRTLSTTDEDSDISKANHSQGQAVPVSEDTATLLEAALRLGAETGGALDISIYPVVKAWGFTTSSYQVPSQETLDQLLSRVDASAVEFDAEARTVTVPDGMEIDLGSIAKGYAGDQIMALFRDCGVTSAIISLGGNVQTLGAKPDGSPWRVAVQAPDGNSYAGVLEVTDQAVITSGGYERYFEADGELYWHIIDPSTGYPAKNGVVSATVVGDSGTVCDALSTALFILGPDKAAEFWRTHGGFEYILITDEEEVILTPGLESSFSLYGDWTGHTLTVVTP